MEEITGHSTSMAILFAPLTTFFLLVRNVGLTFLNECMVL